MKVTGTNKKAKAIKAKITLLRKEQGILKVQIIARDKKIAKYKLQMQEVCLHLEERKEHDYNHHTGVHSDDYYCKFCDKYLRSE